MRKKFKILITVSAVVLIAAAISVSASERAMLSPALGNISQTHTMVKSGQKNSAVCFTEEDFLNHIGLEAASLMITSVPSEAEGELLLGTAKVTPGQKISWRNVGLLRFVANESITECAFSFTVAGGYDNKCVIKIRDDTGNVPVTVGGGITAVTQSDISCYGILEASDSDGDIILYEITDYPTRGIVNITDVKNGSFIYTPYEGFTGVDSFSYRVRDEMGNYSDTCKVSLKVLERGLTDVFSDMSEHYAHSAALFAVDEGYMNCIAENGKLYFDPDENITRSEYLTTVMKALGAPKLKHKKTIFSDDNEILNEHSGYVNAAYELGIIKGIKTDEGLVFDPDSKITRAEAAVILNRILGASGDNDSSDWASNDISALSKLGIINYSENESIINIPLTRAEAAQMLFATKNIYY